MVCGEIPFKSKEKIMENQLTFKVSYTWIFDEKNGLAPLEKPIFKKSRQVATH